MTSCMTSNPSFSGLSIWLTSNDSSFTSLQNVIREHSQETFSPHITLQTIDRHDRLEVKDLEHRIATLSQEIKVFRLRIDRLDWQKEKYFQCVYGLIEPALALSSLRAALCEVIACPNEERSYMPHVSFIYGQLNEQQRQGMAQTLSKSVLKDHPLSFQIHQMELWSTDGPVSDWYMIRTFPFRDEESDV